MENKNISMIKVERDTGKLYLKKEISVADILRITGAGAVVIGLMVNYYKDNALLVDKVNQHSRKLDYHEESIKKLSDISLRQQVLLEKIEK